jgi:hypothetical protein
LLTYLDYANTGGIGPAYVLPSALITTSAPHRCRAIGDVITGLPPWRYSSSKTCTHATAVDHLVTTHYTHEPGGTAMQPLTFEQLNALPTTTDLITAARALRIGRTKAYELARAGEFPVRIIRVGTSYHVPTSELLKVLGVTPLKEADPGITDQQMTG